MDPVYLDNAASTRPAAEALDAMALAARRFFANPSSAHTAGAAAARELERAREELATALHAAAAEVVFTGGGTEANALAILGTAALARGRHIVVTAIEHPAVLANVERLEKLGGFSVTQVGVDRTGVVDVQAVVAAVRPDTALVAVMLVNNELGTIQPVPEISRALAAGGGGPGPKRPRPHLHVDAVQAFGLLPVHPARLGADSIAVSSHKIHGPKGIGALWLRAGSRVAALWDGGGQERTLRSGTENLPGIVGFARAATLAVAAQADGAAARVAALRDTCEARVAQLVPGAVPTVVAPLPGAGRAPHISSLSFPGLPAEPLLHALESRGVLVSAGSACASRQRGPSHVLKAVGVDDDTAVLRFSLSRETTPADVETAVRALQAAYDEIAADARIRGARRSKRI